MENRLFDFGGRYRETSSMIKELIPHLFIHSVLPFHTHRRSNLPPSAPPPRRYTLNTSNPPNSLISSHPECRVPQIPTSSPRLFLCRSASSATPAAHRARYSLAESYSPAYLCTSL